MKRTLYIVLILVAVGLGYLKFQAQTAVTPSPTPTPLLSPAPTASVRSLTTAYFSLEYPVIASASPVMESPDSQTWTFSYMGDTQRASGRTQTELFDGYNFSLTRFEVVSVDDAVVTQAQADRQGIIDACGSENLTTLAPTVIAGHDAQTFTGGCLGEADFYYFIDGSGLYRLTTTVVGPESVIPAYQQTVDTMADSLKFTD